MNEEDETTIDEVNEDAQAESAEDTVEILKQHKPEQLKPEMTERQKEIAKQVEDARERGRQLRDNPPDKPKGNSFVSQGQ